MLQTGFGDFCGLRHRGGVLGGELQLLLTRRQRMQVLIGLSDVVKISLRKMLIAAGGGLKPTTTGCENTYGNESKLFLRCTNNVQT